MHSPHTVALRYSAPVWLLATALACLGGEDGTLSESLAMGPLTRHTVNARYFATPDGKAVFLTGSHTWASLQERGVAGETPDFDYDAYLDFLVSHGHNFMRMWTWEHAQWMQFKPKSVPVRYAPSPFARTGPGKALDGLPKFDLNHFNAAYFNRLRQRVEAARRRNIYVSIMFFQGFSLNKTRGDTDQGNAWHGHPFNAANNVNAIDGNPSKNDTGNEVHTLALPAVTKIQERFVARVIDSVGDLDNVLWEIGNECHAGSVQWQYHMIRFIRQRESTRPQQHLVGMTGAPIDTPALMKSPADWISPKGKQWLNQPPANTGKKIVIVDSDHCDPWKHDPDWVWKNLLSGNHFILMDGYMDYRLESPAEPDVEWNAIRKTMGRAREISERVNLAQLTPKPELASTGYCLAEPGSQYLVFRPSKGTSDVVLRFPPGKYQVAIEHTGSGQQVLDHVVTVQGQSHTLSSPHSGPLLITAKLRQASR